MCTNDNITAFHKEVQDLYLSLGHIVIYVFANLSCHNYSPQNKTNAELSNIGGGVAIIIITFTVKFMWYDRYLYI